MKNKNNNANEDSAKITKQEEIFCHYFLHTFNAKSAVKFAGYKCENPIKKAHELLQQSHIKKCLRRLQKEKQSTGYLSANDVVQKYAQLAFADLNDYLTNQNCDDVGEQSAASSGSMSIDADENVSFDGTLISEIKQTSSGISVKLPDRMKALTWLSDYFELNPQDLHRREIERRKLEVDLLKLSPVEQMAKDKDFEDKAEILDGNLNDEESEIDLSKVEHYKFSANGDGEFMSDANKHISEIWKNNDEE